MEEKRPSFWFVSNIASDVHESSLMSRFVEHDERGSNGAMYMRNRLIDEAIDQTVTILTYRTHAAVTESREEEDDKNALDFMDPEGDVMLVDEMAHVFDSILDEIRVKKKDVGQDPFCPLAPHSRIRNQCTRLCQSTLSDREILFQLSRWPDVVDPTSLCSELAWRLNQQRSYRVSEASFPALIRIAHALFRPSAPRPVGKIVDAQQEQPFNQDAKVTLAHGLDPEPTCSHMITPMRFFHISSESLRDKEAVQRITSMLNQRNRLIKLLEFIKLPWETSQ